MNFVQLSGQRPQGRARHLVVGAIQLYLQARDQGALIRTAAAGSRSLECSLELTIADGLCLIPTQMSFRAVA